nr:complement C5 isoform X1 [Misgurnus anguillicaudatus]
MARLILFCIFHLFACICAQDKAFLITAPKLLRLDASENVMVQLFGYDQDTTVDLYLKKSLAAGDKTYAFHSLKLNSQNNYQSVATLRIMPKDFPKGETHVYLQAISTGGFSKHERIPVTTVNGFLFIQTDKPLYTPDQEVQVRVYSFNEELRKSRRTVTLTFVDPNGIKVEMIDMTDINGAKPLLPPFKIPLKPTFGIWKIEATYAEIFETTATAAFEVKEYVLPSIFVHIEPGANYVSVDNFDSFPLKISAKYAHGTPVTDADVFVRFGYSSPDETVMIPTTFKNHQMTDGNLDVNLNIKSALSTMPDGPQHLHEMKTNTFLRVIVLVQESTGGISEQAVLSHVKFAESPFNLQVVATPPFIKPNLPYTIRVLVTDPLGEPQKGVKVQVKATTRNVNKETETLRFDGHMETTTAISTRDGIAYFIPNIPKDVEKAEFTFNTADDPWNQAQVTFTAESYVSPNHRYLYINLPSESSEFKVGQYTNIEVHFEYREYLSLKTFSYQIISKGKVVKYATVNRINERSQNLNIQITHDMVPSARLLVYYILTGEGTAELVADSVWFDVTATCVNNLNVDLSTLNSQTLYKPKDELNLKVSTKTIQEDSLVALSVVDTALYTLRSDTTNPLKKVLAHIERSDLGCGRGAGKNNADVFDRAGLMIITNANAKTSSEGTACQSTARPKRSIDLSIKLDEQANKFGMFKNCCLAGTSSSPTLETCRDRTRNLQVPADIKKNPNYEKQCKAAFYKCCEFAIKLRHDSEKKIILCRAGIDFMLDLAPSVRSYFPESWLWEEKTIGRSGSVSINKNIPDSLTTWEVKAVGVFSEGICMANPLKIHVSQEVSINIPLPYSMVRGEQIELKGSVYNQRSTSITFSVSLTAPDGVCVFRGVLQGKNDQPHENSGTVDANSIALVKFYIMALEAGTHTLTFTLQTWLGARATRGNKRTEILIKKLRVVPEGIRTELSTGGRIDPRGVFGTPIRKLELKNSIPPKIVPKSTVERSLLVNGEVLGELLSIINNPQGLKQLTTLPRGSAEVELMGLLPIFYVYHYLESTENWDILGKEAAASNMELKRKMKDGITSILSFKLKREYAFSMWSNEDKTASTWVTALVVKTFADMHDYVAVESKILSNTISWLIKQCQKPDGSFVEQSETKPIKLMGAGADVTEQTVFLTSYVMIGIKRAMLIKTLNLEEYKTALNRAASYVSSQSKKLGNLYVRAISSYALTLVDLHSIPAVELYEGLKRKAQVKGNPVTVRFWEETQPSKDPLKPSKTTARTVETTAYVLLNALHRGDTYYAKPIMNWLTQDQRYGGGVHSTQDTIVTLEALSRYSILAQKIVLDMVVNIEYRNKGDISSIKLTQQKPMAKPIEVTQNDDVIVKTAMTNGVSFATLRTVYYEMSESNEKCNFDISIDMPQRDPNSNDPMLLSPRIVACAKYKPHENSVEMESGLTVMEINLPTGVSPIQEDLDMYQNGMESRFSNYEIIGDQVILQIESIPSDSPYCVGFRIQQEFEVGTASASVFKVYEFNAPDYQCMKYYSQSQRLLRLCDGDQCQCMAAECCNFKSTIDPSITADQLKKDVCRENIKYAFKVLISSSETAGDFVIYKAIVKQVLKKEQTDDIKTDSEIELVRRVTCSSTNIEVDKHYLIQTAESIQTRVGRVYKYKFPLDSQAWVEWWPTETDVCTDAACGQYINVLGDFEFDFLISGC